MGGTEHDTKELGYFLVWKKTFGEGKVAEDKRFGFHQDEVKLP